MITAISRTILLRRPPPRRSRDLAPRGPDQRGDRRAAPAPGRSPTPLLGGPAASRPGSRRPGAWEEEGDGAGRAGRRGPPCCAGPLADLTRPKVGVDVPGRVRPVGEPADEGRCLVAAPSGVSRHSCRMRARNPVPPHLLGYTHTVRSGFAVPAAAEQAAAKVMKGRTAGRCVAGTPASPRQSTHHGRRRRMRRWGQRRGRWAAPGSVCRRLGSRGVKNWRSGWSGFGKQPSGVNAWGEGLPWPWGLGCWGGSVLSWAM